MDFMDILNKEMTTDLDLFHMSHILDIDLEGIYRKDELPKKAKVKKCYIINLQNSDEGNGTHWVAAYQDKDTLYYFDSFGVPPPYEIMKFSLTKKIRFNDTKIQKSTEGFCGQWCILFLYYIRHKDGYDKFLKIIEKKTN